MVVVVVVMMMMTITTNFVNYFIIPCDCDENFYNLVSLRGWASTCDQWLDCLL